MALNVVVVKKKGGNVDLKAWHSYPLAVRPCKWELIPLLMTCPFT